MLLRARVEQEVVRALGAGLGPPPQQNLGKDHPDEQANKPGEGGKRPAVLDREPCRNAVHIRRRRHPLSAAHVGVGDRQSLWSKPLSLGAFRRR